MATLAEPHGMIPRHGQGVDAGRAHVILAVSELSNLAQGADGTIRRENYRHRRADAWFTFDMEFALVGLHQGLAQRESQSGPLKVPIQS